MKHWFSLHLPSDSERQWQWKGGEGQMRWALQVPWLTPWRQFVGCGGVERGNPSGARCSPWVEEVKLGDWESQDTYSSQGRAPERREMHMERILRISRGSPLSIHLSSDHYMYSRKLPKTEEKTERIRERENSAQNSKRAGYNAHLY